MLRTPKGVQAKENDNAELRVLNTEEPRAGRQGPTRARDLGGPVKQARKSNIVFLA
jgi:hypothetical protein